VRLLVPTLFGLHIGDDFRQKLFSVVAQFHPTHVGGDWPERTSKRLEPIDDFAMMVADKAAQ